MEPLFFSFWNMTYLKLNPNKCWISLSIHTLDPWVHVQYFLHFHAFLVLTVNSWASQFLPTPPRIAGSTLVNFVDFRDKVRDRGTMFLYWQIGFHPFFKQGCQNDPVENQMMKPNFESHKQNQTNTWWQSAGLLFRPQIGFALLTIEFCWFHHQRTLYKDEGSAGVTSWLDFFELTGFHLFWALFKSKKNALPSAQFIWNNGPNHWIPGYTINS